MKITSYILTSIFIIYMVKVLYVKITINIINNNNTLS